MASNGKQRHTKLGRKKLGLTAIVAVLVIGGGWFAWQHMVTAQAGQANPAITTVRTGTIEEVITAQGKLEPKEYVDVGAQVSGQLSKIHVEIGDTVNAGDLIAEIDPEAYVARVQGAEARLRTQQAQRAQQEAQVEKARQQFDRTQRLVQSRAVSQEVFENAQTDLKIAQAQLMAIDAQIEETRSTLDGDRVNLGYTRIYAPMDGTVVLQETREGQTLNASQSAPTIVQLANLDTMTVRAQVAEADVMRLHPGMDVYFTTLGAQDRRWQGSIRQILPSPEIINDVVLYNVLVDVDNRDRQLMTGMSTQMFFVYGRAENVPVIPVTALGRRLTEQDSEHGQAYEIRVTGDGRNEERRIIHIGLMDRTIAEIRAGLQPGDQVLLPQLSATQQTPSRGMRGGPRL